MRSRLVSPAMEMSSNLEDGFRLEEFTNDLVFFCCVPRIIAVMISYL